MNYVAIDIETTGLDPGVNDIVEVGAIFDDLLTDLTAPDYLSGEEFRAVIVNPDSEPYAMTPFCATMHSQLWPEIVRAEKILYGIWEESSYLCRDTHLVYDRISDSVMHCKENMTYYCSPESLSFCFSEWIKEFVAEGTSIRFAGKNVANFDIPFLKEPPYLFGQFFNLDFRSIDPAIFYWEPGDESLPSLRKCLNRAGLGEPTDPHKSLGDAYDVVRLVRHCLNDKVSDFHAKFSVDTPPDAG